MPSAYERFFVDRVFLSHLFSVFKVVNPHNQTNEQICRCLRKAILSKGEIEIELTNFFLDE